MRSRRNPLLVAEVVSVSWIVDVDAPSEVTFPHLCDPQLLKECMRCGDHGKKPDADR
jgi:hypothetical protein